METLTKQGAMLRFESQRKAPTKAVDWLRGSLMALMPDDFKDFPTVLTHIKEKISEMEKRFATKPGKVWLSIYSGSTSDGLNRAWLMFGNDNGGTCIGMIEAFFPKKGGEQ